MPRESYVMYGLFSDPPGDEPFSPFGSMTTSKVEALKELRRYRQAVKAISRKGQTPVCVPHCGHVYLAKITYTRCDERGTKKGKV